MVAFYPEFETTACESPEVIFLLDLSNSMNGAAVEAAKKVVMLAMYEQHFLFHTVK